MKKDLLLFFALLISAPSFSQVFVDTLGSSGNAFSNAFGPRTNLWYDKDLNTIVFVHRSNVGVNGALGLGNIMYDYSTTGGVTWHNDQGPPYRDTTNTSFANTGSERGRFPQGAIYNPPGNTNPANSYVTCYGPISDGTNWVDQYKGTTKIGSSSNVQGLYPLANINALLPAGFHIVKNTGVIWASSPGVVAPDQSGYDDTIVLSRGIFNTTTHDIDYSFSRFYHHDTSYVTHSMAWSDDGQTGYVVIIGSEAASFTTTADSNYYPIVYKTTDSGSTWIRAASIDLTPLIAVLPSSPTLKYTTGFDVDCAVDKNNNLHIAVDIGILPINGGFTIDAAYGHWGVFDVYTRDGGVTWRAQLLARPQTFRQVYGNTGEDNRAQATRSWDGSKVFISWFDVDTTRVGPDMHSIGYDVDNQLWTSEVNFTGNTGLTCDGRCYFGCISYYAIDNGTHYCIPMVFDIDTSLSTVVQYFYLGGACLDTFNHPSTGVNVTTVNDVVNPTSFSKLYPNPSSGNVFIEVALHHPQLVDIEVSNAMGQRVYHTVYKNRIAANNKIPIDVSFLMQGIYFVRINMGNYSETKVLVKQ